MKRPLLVWLAFAACALVGFAVLGWFTREMLRLERAGDEARRIAAVEENTRLALWRMDSALAGIHGLEAARPWQDYEPFFRADGALTRELTPLPAGAVMLPSPLLGFTPPFVRLHFQIEPDGTICSPQTPPATLRAAAIATGASPERLDACAGALAELRVRISGGEFAGLLEAPAPAREDRATVAKKEPAPAPVETPVRDDREPDVRKRSADETAPAREPAVEVASNVEKPPPAPSGYQPFAAPAGAQQGAQMIQVGKSIAEQQQRQNLLVAQNEINSSVNRRGLPSARDAGASVPAGSSSDAIVAPAGGPASSFPPASPSRPAAGASAEGFADSAARADAPRGPLAGEIAAAAAPLPTPLENPPERARAERREAKAGGPVVAATDTPVAIATGEGPMQALWAGGELVFARRVAVGGRALVQGAWLDWNELRAWLLSRVTDLLPAARLEPAPAGAPTLAAEATRQLAFIPARLVPGPVEMGSGPGWNPLEISLGAAWGSAVIGAFALALLLRGTLRLSERRGAFVSAVTHELRTPLTTFRMYTEMLAGGMVPDEAKRHGYLETLRREAERLSHLVENVLSYARLERGRARARVEETTPGALLARSEERLRQRAQQGGLALRVAFAEDAADCVVRTDTTAVEQILFNLVDNAAKYARRADGAGEVVIAIDHRGGGRGRTNPGRLVIHVGDNGPGIAASVRRRLFQPFSKSAAEAAQSQPGVGLGLALSRRLARDELRGDLTLERSDARGTVFRLELPTQA